MMLFTTIAILIGPIGLGALAGILVRHLRGGRAGGLLFALSGLILPAALTTAMTIYFPIVGLWDGMLLGLLLGTGFLIAAHRACTDPREILLTAVSAAFGFAILEVGARLFLGAPPSYPIQEGPQLLLANALRLTAPDAQAFRGGEIPHFLASNALQADLARPGEQTPATERPPAPLLTSELVCSIVYGAAYQGVLDVSREREVIFPDRFTPRPDVARRVLHIGDSLVFGSNVARHEAFAARLGELEPRVEHVNGGISGMAPDGYFVVLQSWLARHPIDLATIYIFAGNDLGGVDAPHMCSDGKSLLVYDEGQARLRFPDAPKTDRRIGLSWLVRNSPLPYLLRVMIAYDSAAAAFVGSALTSWALKGVSGDSPTTQLQHIELVLATARDQLRSRNIAFAVVMIPAGVALPPSASAIDFPKEIIAMATRLGIPVLDATPPIRDAFARGENPVQEDGSHLNALGHGAMAEWLHSQLPAATGLPAL